MTTTQLFIDQGKQEAGDWVFQETILLGGSGREHAVSTALGGNTQAGNENKKRNFRVISEIEELLRGLEEEPLPMASEGAEKSSDEEIEWKLFSNMIAEKPF